eukprot:351669-Chlamydomonas_euryale.AAC.4
MPRNCRPCFCGLPLAVSLDECKEGWSLEGAVPCVPDGEFRRQQAALRGKISALSDTRELAA